MAGIPLPVTQAAAALATEPPAAPLATAAAIMTAGPPAAAVSKPDPLASAPRQRRPTGVPTAEPVAAAGTQPLDPAQRTALERRLMAATARLLVEDAQGVSRGTGTVIDCRQGEALILTCGHIFRDSQGKGRVEVDLFGADGPRGVAGQVVSWDLKRDLALVSIFTDRQIEPVRVGGTDRSTQAGEPVVTVGCDGGDDPTIQHSRVTAVDKYLGPANVQVAGQPVQGRSGGGLFAVDGTLIGVCNAADPADNEGLFAALPTIHEQLDEAGLAFVYRSIYPSAGPVDVAAIPNGPALPSMPAEMPPVSFDRRDRADALPTAATAQNGAPSNAGAPSVSAPKPLSPGEQALIDHVWRNDGDAEVICIVRPKGGAQSPSDVFVLQGASREFVEQLSKSPPERAQSGTSQPGTSPPGTSQPGTSLRGSALGGHATPHHAAPPATRSDVATLPASELTR
jgi:S1-C subfamily serine protease